MCACVLVEGEKGVLKPVSARVWELLVERAALGAGSP